MEILIAFVVVALQKNNQPVGHEYLRSWFNRLIDGVFDNPEVELNVLGSFVLLVLMPVLGLIALQVFWSGWLAWLLSLVLGYVMLMSTLTLHKLRRRVLRYRRAWLDHNKQQMKDLAAGDWQVDVSLPRIAIHNHVVDGIFAAAFHQIFVYLFWYWCFGLTGLLFYFLCQVWRAGIDQMAVREAYDRGDRWIDYVDNIINVINSVAARILALTFWIAGNAWSGLSGSYKTMLHFEKPIDQVVVDSARGALSLNRIQQTGADCTLIGKRQIILARALISRTIVVWFILFALLTIILPN